MQRSLRLLAVGCFALVLNSTAVAQRLQRVEGPLRAYTLDLATGTIEPGELSSGSAADVPGDTFANTTTSGFFGTPPVGEEWIDWGVKAGGMTGLTCTLELAYGTTELDPSIGGPGAAIDIAVYSGTLGNCGAGDVASEEQRLSFTGLPGSTDGSPVGVVMTVLLATSNFYLNDGAIGWGYVGVDGRTGPLLITVGMDPTGTVDGYDVYSPAPATSGVCTGTFTFPFPGIGSFYLRLEEDDGSEPGSQVLRPGTGVNVGVLSLGSGPPKIGQPWDPSITTPAVPTPTLDFIALSTQPIAPVIVPGIGELLIGIVFPNPIFVAAVPVGAGSPFNLHFPFNCNYIGAPLTCQAGQADITGTIGLTDAIDIVLGL